MGQTFRGVIQLLTNTAIFFLYLNFIFVSKTLNPIPNLKLMKTTLTLLLFFSISVAFAQSKKEVETAVQNLRTAMLAEDATTLKSLTSENLSYGHSAGKIENQEEFLAVFSGGKTDYQTWDITEQEIKFNGKNLALVRHKVSAEIASSGTTNPLKIGLLMVWVKEKGDWKLLARQAFRLPV